MKLKILLTLSVTFCYFLSYSQINIQWESRFDGTGNSIDKVVDYELDASGNSYVLGTSFNGSDFDIVTIKYDNTGTQLWLNTYGGSGLDEAKALAIDSNGDIVVTGSRFIAGSDWDIFVLKINGTNGTQQWAQTISGITPYDAGYDIGNDVVINATNQIYVTGSQHYSATDLDYIVLQFASNGTLLNSASNGGGGSDEGLFLELDATGNVYLGGTREFATSATYFDFRVMKFTSNLGITWESYGDSGFGKIDKPNGMTLDASGNIYIAGQGFTSTVEQDDYLLMKFNNAGVIQWTNMYSGDDGTTDKINALVYDNTSNSIFVTGKSKSVATAEDYYTIAYDANGVELWNQRFTTPGLGLDEATDIIISSSNSLYVTGYSELASSNNDYYTIKYDLAGNEAWSTRFDGPAGNSDKALKMRTDLSENIYISGTSHGGNATNLDYSTIKYCQLETVAPADASICLGQSTTLTATSVGSLGSNYTWAVVSGDPITLSNFSCTVCASPIASPTITTTYTVSSQSAGGCIDYDTVTVTVNAIPTPTIYNDTPLDYCIGDSVTLYTDVYTNYLWSDGSTANGTTVFGAANYSVTITDLNGCQASANVTVTNYNLPTVDAGLPQTICPENTAQLLATGATSYQWTVDPTLSQLLIDNPIASPITQTKYYVTGTDGNNCSNIDSVTIFLFTSPNVDAGLPTTICINDSTQLLATGAISYNWTPSPSMPIQNIDNPWVFPTSQTKYIVTGTDANNCTAMDSVTISTNNLPFVNAGVDQTFCEGDSAHIFATGALTYSWEASPTLSDLSSSNPWASPISQTDYIVSGTDINNCTNTDTVTMFVNAAPLVNAGIDTALCIGNTIQLNASGAISYLWTNSPTLTPINVSNPMVNPTSFTTYYVQGTDNNGCKGFDSVNVSIHSLPIVDAGADSYVCDGDSIQLDATGALNYVWSFNPTLSQLIGANPWALPIIPTTYTVAGTDANGCSGSDQVTISINPNPLPPTLTQDGNLLISDSLTGNQWYLDGVLLVGETNDTLVYSSHTNGVFTLIYTDPNGCGSASDAINANITIVDVGITENISNLSVTIFPNPSTDIINISSEDNFEIVTILDLNGKIIYHNTYINSNSLTISLGEFENGIYLLKIENSNSYTVKRIIKN